MLQRNIALREYIRHEARLTVRHCFYEERKARFLALLGTRRLVTKSHLASNLASSSSPRSEKPQQEEDDVLIMMPIIAMLKKITNAAFSKHVSFSTPA
ncbi:hypothetical protein ElyMa_006509900 [Elysia marginata]|uniref:Uncharacterized protein n=1 Tax=Elysia marginata TaxID=1093978 RepID=A0AAV4I450_9GAST|nr:hypothetical protein ElyMa_006509900 [Elysia marginata]